MNATIPTIKSATVRETKSRIGRRHALCAQCGLKPVRSFGETCWTCKDRVRLSTREQKIEWLLEHPNLWEGFPRPDVGNHWLLVFIALQHAGLYSLNTDWTNADITGLISDARKSRREAQ